jgi:hypothetical protein
MRAEELIRQGNDFENGGHRSAGRGLRDERPD